MEKKLIKLIDNYIEENGKEWVTIQVANKLAKDADLKLENESNFTGVLIKEGKIPHAFKLSGAKSYYVIPHSKPELALKNKFIICQNCKGKILRKNTFKKKEYIQCGSCSFYTINTFFKGKRKISLGPCIDYDGYWKAVFSDDFPIASEVNTNKNQNFKKGYTLTKPEPKAGTDTGCMFSVPIAIVFIIVGILLSMTGIGAIIGVPLIIAGIVAPFFSYPITKAMVSGNCPYCGHKIYVYKLLNPGVNCAACKKRVLVRDDKFIKAE